MSRPKEARHNLPTVSDEVHLASAFSAAAETALPDSESPWLKMSALMACPATRRYRDLWDKVDGKSGVFKGDNLKSLTTRGLAGQMEAVTAPWRQRLRGRPRWRHWSR